MSHASVCVSGPTMEYNMYMQLIRSAMKILSNYYRILLHVGSELKISRVNSV